MRDCGEIVTWAKVTPTPFQGVDLSVPIAALAQNACVLAQALPEAQACPATMIVRRGYSDSFTSSMSCQDPKII